jgi:hypothetical protein
LLRIYLDQVLINTLIWLARILFDNKQIELSELDTELFESSDIGRFIEYNGVSVPDLPMEIIEELNEADYQEEK